MGPESIDFRPIALQDDEKKKFMDGTSAYDEDVDNAVASMTSSIEPLLIIFLAVVVDSIAIALFMPLPGSGWFAVVIGGGGVVEGKKERRRNA